MDLHFEHGTLVAAQLPDDKAWSRWFVFDDRTGVYRAPAHAYRDVVLALRDAGVPAHDKAGSFSPLPVSLTKTLEPFPHQSEALSAWQTGGRRGIVEMPTGSGKTLLGVLAIQAVARPTLVVVPTIDLMMQWERVLTEWLGQEVGMLGGGSRERRPITVTTYDSAAAQTEFHGDRFGFLICDECHHLPAPAYQFVAAGSLAPFRLGLTATLDRADGKEAVCEELLGPVAHRVRIDEIEGEFLAPYEVERVEVELSESERTRYETHRKTYLDFVRKQGISFGRRDGWTQFIQRSQRSEEGREAFRAYREQRKIALCSDAKVDALWDIVVRHRDERIIVFTEDNEMVFRLSSRFLLPSITHKTKAAERKSLLAAFDEGRLPVLLTSKVLNEGVDVPAANVGVVLSGNGSVREHVQRLGRILRKQPDKRAILYEVCSSSTAESGISERRRQHQAYRRSPA